jgi:lipid-binding SYLF domain-containing protein
MPLCTHSSSRKVFTVSSIIHNSMNKRNFLVTGASLAAATVLTTGCTTTGGASSSPAERRQAIDSSSDAALTRLYREAPGSQEIIAASRGTLIFPAVVSAGFIIGGSHGQGVLRKAGKSSGYYRMNEASIGLLGGAQSQALFISFMTDAAMNSFLNSRGWTVGVDGTVTLLTVGINARVTTQTVQQPIVGFVLTNGGLMANISINGNRITQLDL